MSEHSDRQTSVEELPDAMLGNQFPEDIDARYRRNFRALRRDAQARPGLASLQSMLAERAAYSHARIKAMDAATRDPYGPDYDRANQTFLKAAQQILAAAKTDE